MQQPAKLYIRNDANVRIIHPPQRAYVRLVSWLFAKQPIAVQIRLGTRNGRYACAQAIGFEYRDTM